MTFSHPPEALDGSSPPPGWSSGVPHELRYELGLCNRISIDQFERGPLFFLLESHNNGIPPSSCEGDYLRARILTALWLDDEEIVAHLKSAYGLPASVAQFGLFEQENLGIVNSTWTFGAPNGEPSILHGQRSTTDDTQEVISHRYFWMAGSDRISYMDYDGVYSHPSLIAPGVAGQIAPPLLHGSVGPWAGYGGEGGGLEIVAPIVEFSDLTCEQPL